MFQDPNTSDNLEAMNRDKVASILQYLDDVDQDSCIGDSISAVGAVQPYNNNNNNHQHHQQHHQQKQVYREPSYPQQHQHDLDNFSPSPSAPTGYQQQGNTSPSSRSATVSRMQQQYQQEQQQQMQQQQQRRSVSSSSPFPSQQRALSQQSSSSYNQQQHHQQQHHQQQHYSVAQSSLVSGSTATANAQYSNLRRKVNNIVSERDNAFRQVENLKQMLQVAEERERTKIQQIRDQVEEENTKSRKQMQSAIDEHLRCIRKLLSEKENLIKKVEGLTTEVASATNKRDAEIKRLRELHEKSLTDLRNRLAAQERAKRDEWSQKEAKRIKESTMKAMEPDIALLLNRHKSEKKRLEEELSEVTRKKEQLTALKEQEMAEFKNKLIRDMEESNQREREAFRSQMQDQTDRLMRMLEEEKRMQEERRRNLEKNHEEVRQSLIEQLSEMAKKVASCEKNEHTRQVHSSAEVAEAVAKAQAEMAEQNKKMREALEKERASLAENVKQASEQLLEARAAEIRQQCQHERDAAIAKVVEKLEQEQLKALQESREAEKRWKDVNNQLQREIDRLRTELECTSAHFRSAKEAVTERDNRIRDLQEQVVNLKHISSADTAATEDAFERRITALDNAWKQKMQSLEAEHVRNTHSLTGEVEHLRRQLELQKEEHQSASKVAAQKHSAELAVINERVTLTLNKKEAQIRQMADTINNLERQVQMRDEELERHDALLNGEDGGDGF